jgi:hypothetical protein
MLETYGFAAIVAGIDYVLIVSAALLTDHIIGRKRIDLDH